MRWPLSHRCPSVCIGGSKLLACFLACRTPPRGSPSTTSKPNSKPTRDIRAPRPAPAASGHTKTPSTNSHLARRCPAIRRCSTRRPTPTTDALTQRHELGGEMLDAATPRDQHGNRRHRPAIRDFETSARRAKHPDYRQTEPQPYERTTMSNAAAQPNRPSYRWAAAACSAQPTRFPLPRSGRADVQSEPHYPPHDTPIAGRPVSSAADRPGASDPASARPSPPASRRPPTPRWPGSGCRSPPPCARSGR
jgi:hypothetical protein